MELKERLNVVARARTNNLPGHSPLATGSFGQDVTLGSREEDFVKVFSEPPRLDPKPSHIGSHAHLSRRSRSAAQPATRLNTAPASATTRRDRQPSTPVQVFSPRSATGSRSASKEHSQPPSPAQQGFAAMNAQNRVRQAMLRSRGQTTNSTDFALTVKDMVEHERTTRIQREQEKVAWWVKETGRLKEDIIRMGTESERLKQDMEQIENTKRHWKDEIAMADATLQQSMEEAKAAFEFRHPVEEETIHLDGEWRELMNQIMYKREDAQLLEKEIDGTRSELDRTNAEASELAEEAAKLAEANAKTAELAEAKEQQRKKRAVQTKKSGGSAKRDGAKKTHSSPKRTSSIPDSSSPKRDSTYSTASKRSSLPDRPERVASNMTINLEPIHSTDAMGQINEGESPKVKKKKPKAKAHKSHTKDVAAAASVPVESSTANLLAVDFPVEWTGQSTMTAAASINI